MISMDKAAGNITTGVKARLDSPLRATDPRVLGAVESLHQEELGALRGAFRSTAMKPEAGIPIFGLVVLGGAAVLCLVIWLVFFDRGGPTEFVETLNVGGVIGVAVLGLIGIGLIAYGGMKVRAILRDIGQV